MILGATMVATCEAFVLAKKLGLDLQTFFDISSKASGQSWSMTSYCPVPGVGPDTPADHDYEGGFAAALMLKDLRLADGSRAAASAPTRRWAPRPRSSTSASSTRGGGSKDFSGIIKMIDDSWTPPRIRRDMRIAPIAFARVPCSWRLRRSGDQPGQQCPGEHQQRLARPRLRTPAARLNSMAHGCRIGKDRR